MAIDLEGICGQAASYLGDEGGSRYPEEALVTCVRLALGEYNLLQASLGMPQASLAGLDGAEETSLPEAHAGMIVEGAAGYAAALREAGRIEVCGLDTTSPAGLAAWSARRLEAFRKMLEEVRTADEIRRVASLRMDGAGAVSPAGWPLDGREDQT